jgi:hypothetical protein
MRHGLIINFRLINDKQFQINMTHIRSVVMEDINKEEEEEEMDIKHHVIANSEEVQRSRLPFPNKHDGHQSVIMEDINKEEEEEEMDIKNHVKANSEADQRSRSG